MERDGKYIYGVIPDGARARLGPIGIGGHGDEVYTIPYEDIAAVVSDYPATDYTALNKEKLIGALAQHQHVVEQTMKRFTILPMKFGTQAESQSKIETVLRKGYAAFREALAKLKNKIQIELVATWDLDSVLGEISEEEPVAELRSRIGADSSPATFGDRVRLGEMVKRSIDSRRDELQKKVLGFLAEFPCDLQENPLLGDRFVLNLAALLGREKQAEFERKLQELDSKLAGKLSFRLVGPLPPYSFSTVEVKFMPSKGILEARTLLGVDQHVSIADIKRAYYQKARECHPDGGSDGDSASERFKQIKEASQLLIDCCLAHQGGGPALPQAGETICSLEPEAVEEAVLVSIRRTGGTGL